MTWSAREQAFFGGWDIVTLTGDNDREWGPPHRRCYEVASSAIRGLLLPRASDWLCPGVPYWVWNAGAENIEVKQDIGGGATLVRTVTPGTVGMFLWSGTGWHGEPVGNSQEGSIHPTTFIVPIGVQAREFDVLAHIVGNNGYDGSYPAAVRVILQSTGAFGALSQTGYAFTTGTSYLGVSWASGSLVLLEVQNDAVILGWGGNGGRAGISGTGSAAGFDGEDGGTAVRAEIPLRITVADAVANPVSGLLRQPGFIIGGGGGGGGGGGSTSNASVLGGGGGGGRGGNMDFNGQFIGSQGGAATAPAGEGGGGGPFVSGLGGLGTNGGGDGGTGGSRSALAGTPGAAGVAAGGAGGAAGNAISYSAAAGEPTILSGGSNIYGATVQEG